MSWSYLFDHFYPYLLGLACLVYFTSFNVYQRQILQRTLRLANEQNKLANEQSTLLLQNQFAIEIQNIKLFYVEQLNSISSLFEKRLTEQSISLIGQFSHNNVSMQESIRKGLLDLNFQVSDTLKRQAQILNEKVDNLNTSVDKRLELISERVEQRLAAGFEKTSATFTDIVKRLALIDDAQKKLTELSSNVVSLQSVLADKRSRGAFGEVQLKNLIQNMLPENSFAFQHTLSNGTRADCMLILPAPSGNIAIDSKFPLENYHRMTDNEAAESTRKKAQQDFKQDIKKHINDIASKYIVKGETADGALMFIPAEAVFAEIHGHFPDLIELAQRANVWLTSPTTMMAVLTTACAVIKDTSTREHIHVIQAHLHHLAQDFSRFEGRMGKLAKHIDQAQEDVKQVNVSARKITQRFSAIERADQLDQVAEAELMLDKIL